METKKMSRLKFRPHVFAATFGALAVTVAASAARADVLVDLYIYNGSVVGTNANAATSVAAAAAAVQTYEFTYSTMSGGNDIGLNAIQWNSGAGSTNTGSDFLGSWISNITGFTQGTLAGFENQVLSVAQDSTTAFFKISGQLSGSIQSGSQISHDDGLTFIVGSDTLINSPGETNNIPSDVSPVPTQNYSGAPFDLYYVEGNGAPAVLNVDLHALDMGDDDPRLLRGWVYGLSPQVKASASLSLTETHLASQGRRYAALLLNRKRRSTKGSYVCGSLGKQLQNPKWIGGIQDGCDPRSDSALDQLVKKLAGLPKHLATGPGKRVYGFSCADGN
jgi:hypothetical protein